MAVERRQRAVLVCLCLCFVAFAAQLVHIQWFGDTRPPSLAMAPRKVAQQPVRTVAAAPGLDVKFRRWWRRNVQARLDRMPAKAKSVIRQLRGRVEAA
ncbi:MAG: hypothetical protein JSS65_11945 [Armatimonadetes bacterium]|nr:hypothetical protein [Armatimonadota bacterium]